VIVVTLATSAVLAGCTAPAEPTTGHDHALTVGHVHAIVPDPTGEGFLLGTHDGIYTATVDGELGDRVSNTDFDAMGLTAVGDALIASGHPGQTTPPELGSPNLGIIRSYDGAKSWSPVSFTGEKDFHVLAAGNDETLFGIASDSIELLRSDDTGQTWSPAGEINAVGLVIDATGQLIAATPDGLQLSTDEGATFTPLSEAPLVYLLAVSPDGKRLVGVGSGGQIWAKTSPGAQWDPVGTTHGSAQAITTTNDGVILIFDDSGLTALRE
jgi:ligand-binding sensor domain-containing protein